MSNDQRVLTPTEITKIEAETKEIYARITRETEKAEADIRKVTAERDNIETQTRAVNFTLREQRARIDQIEREERRMLANDYYHRVYRFADAVSASSVDECMDSLSTWDRIDPSCDVEIIFLSPGGSVIHGFALFDFIQKMRARGHRVTTGTLGYAASMAGVLLQAGDVRYMGSNSAVLIHEISSLAIGKTGEIEDELEFIKKLQERILTIFADRSGGKTDVDYLRDHWKRKDWWLLSDEALRLGLIDEVR